MLEASTIYCEVVEKIWTSTIYNSGNNSFTFMLAMRLHLPANHCEKGLEASNIISTLYFKSYNGKISNFDKIVRKYLRKEWSYFCDNILKVFSDKISNFDVITIFMHHVLYMLLNDIYLDLRSLVMYEIAAKLGG